MMLHEVTEQAGARPRRKRVGRGESSGMGRTSGRGNKGSQSRAGAGGRYLHEGGQRPFYAGIAKRGFNNFNFRHEYQPVNLGTLEKYFKAGEKVDAAALLAHGLIGSAALPVKILGEGALTKKLEVTVDAASAKAKEAIEKSGGSVALLPRRDSAALWKAKRNSAKKKAKA